MGDTEAGDPILLPVPAAKLRATVSEMVGDKSPKVGTEDQKREVVVREVVSAVAEMPKTPETVKGRLDPMEVSLFAA